MPHQLTDFPTIESAFAQAMRQRVLVAVGADLDGPELDAYATLVAELVTWDSLKGGGQISQDLRESAKRAFVLLRAGLGIEEQYADETRHLRAASLAVIADQPQEARKLLTGLSLSAGVQPEQDWGEFVRQTVFSAWLGLIRQESASDVKRARESLAALRIGQKSHETAYLQDQDVTRGRRVGALELVAFYLLGTAAERLSEYLIEGTSDGAVDIAAQLDMYFDRCIRAMERSPSILGLDVVLLLQPAAQQLASSSLRAVTRGANTLAVRFADSLITRPIKPIFQLLPPQRMALREQGLISSSHRSIVVNFPTSSGKTLLAQFSIIQALNDLGSERGWVAYVAPTRALVNQIANRLAQDFEALGKRVEKLSPALEFDTGELSALTPKDPEIDGPPVDVMICTPEKLDLLMRREDLRSSLGRLALVVIDEAHSLGANDSRAIKLELLLAMINREHGSARFLMLTPFISNATQVAMWLDQSSYKDYSIEAEWTPNDRIIGISTPPPKGPETRGVKADHLYYQAVATPKRTLQTDGVLRLDGVSPELGFTVAALHGSVGNLAAATAQVLSRRGPTVILCRAVRDTWTCADHLVKADEGLLPGESQRLAVSRLVEHELGPMSPLVNLLKRGVAVHHAGLPEEIAQAIEWLFENRMLHSLCATTTLAQGVNFPIANLVLGSIYPVGKYGEKMPYADFWNIAGRVGRVDQEAIGVVALAAPTDASVKENKQFLERAMMELVSTLLIMVADLKTLAADKGLETLTWKKEWSNFGQFIAHTLRQVGQAKFADQVELVLRGTLGYQVLREQDAPLARTLLTKTRQYAQTIARDMGAVTLVDSTGFSFESVRKALAGLGALENLDSMLDPASLFTGGRGALRDVMGVLLSIPEVREDLVDSGGGESGRIAEMLSDWVKGMSLPDLAQEYFSESAEDDRLTVCVRKFKRLAMTSSWGLASVLAMKFGDELDDMSSDSREAAVNIPSMVLYGVWSREAIALRAAGVPRSAAVALSQHIQGSITPYALRKKLRVDGEGLWKKAMGADKGADYFSVWQMLQGR